MPSLSQKGYLFEYKTSCFVAMYDDKLVAFLAIMQFPGINGAKRVHRMVVLPEYQGLGIAYHFGDYITKKYVHLLIIFEPLHVYSCIFFASKAAKPSACSAAGNPTRRRRKT
jgi:GNAT superfamily N-acetyltransferase